MERARGSDNAPARTTMSTERMIGNYVLGPVLGRGGMSVVHAAEHRFLGDRVAIKLLRSHLAGDPAATVAFITEATRTRAIDHPGVVRVLDFGSDGDAFYLVMERLEGESLATRLERKGRLNEPEVRRIGAAVADAVAAAHARGIVHRDLKPGNIVLVADQPKVIDFGIARELAGPNTSSRAGTIAYMAPEQLTGGLVAPCVDIWALGVLLYEALSGRMPFDGFSGGRSPQLFETPRRLGEIAPVSAALEDLVARCLERDPARRPQSMQVVAESLRMTASDQRLTEDLEDLTVTEATTLAAASPGRGEPAPPRASSPTPPRARAPEASPRRKSNASAEAARRKRPRDRDRRGDAHTTSEARLDALERRRQRRWLIAASIAALVLGVITARVTQRLGSRDPVVAPVASRAAAAGAPVILPPEPAGAPPAGAPVILPPEPIGALPANPPADGEATAPAEPTARPAAPAGDSAATRPAEPAGAQPVDATPSPTGPGGATDDAIAQVEVRSSPPGAAIIVAGKRIGTTPATVPLALPASLTILRSGYRPLRMRAQHAGPIDVRLTPNRRPRPPRAAAGETLD